MKARQVFLHVETDLHGEPADVAFRCEQPLYPPFKLRVSCVSIGTVEVARLDLLVMVGDNPCRDPMGNGGPLISYRRWLDDKRLRESILAGYTVIEPETVVLARLVPRRALDRARHVVGCMNAWTARP